VQPLGEFEQVFHCIRAEVWKATLGGLRKKSEGKEEQRRREKYLVLETKKNSQLPTLELAAWDKDYGIFYF
jgi:hypothetical protein